MMKGTFLEIRDGSESRLFPLGAEKLNIGRGPHNEIILRDDLASRSHACIEYGSGKYFLRDLDSRNGTRHNGQKVAALTELENGDQIRIGRHVIFLLVNSS